MLPNFLIIGAARSGTTSIFHSLGEHPEVFVPVKKELQFFTQNWEQGVDWYKGFFTGINKQKAIGEASVSYTYPQYTLTPARIAELIPDVRLIYIVRNPVERTFSHYLYYRFYSMVETREFQDAINIDPIYLGASSYYTWITRYLDYFKREQLLVIIFEDFVKQPVEVLQTIYRFIGVNDVFVPHRSSFKTNETFKAKQESVYKLYRKFSLSHFRFLVEKFVPQHLRPLLRNKIHTVLGTHNQIPVMSTAIKEEIFTQFKPEIMKLGEFLKRDLSIWDIV